MSYKTKYNPKLGEKLLKFYIEAKHGLSHV